MAGTVARGGDTDNYHLLAPKQATIGMFPRPFFAELINS